MCMRAPPLRAQPSATYWVCVQVEEAEQSSGVTHSILSCMVALWWKRSLLQTKHNKLACGSKPAFDHFKQTVSCHYCAFHVGISHILKPVCCCKRCVSSWIINSHRGGWWPRTVRWFNDSTAGGVKTLFAHFLIPLCSIITSCRIQWGRETDHRMALNNRKTRVESRSSIWVNQLNFVSSNFVAIDISLNHIYSKSIEILCLEFENLWKSCFSRICVGGIDLRKCVNLMHIVQINLNKATFYQLHMFFVGSQCWGRGGCCSLFY